MQWPKGLSFFVAIAVILLEIKNSEMLDYVPARFSRKFEVPFIVSLRRTDYEENCGEGHHKCSGVIIDATTVVTSANCLFDQYGNVLNKSNSFTIVAASRYLRSDKEPGIKRIPTDIVIHPDFKRGGGSDINDIAYLTFLAHFDLMSDVVQAIEMEGAEVPEDTRCFTYGWGWLDESNNTEAETKLQYVGDVAIFNKAECRAKYHRLDIELSMDKICAGVVGGKTGTCLADPGGLLVCRDRLVGIVTMGAYCKLKGYPTVYTKIAYHQAFLEKRTHYRPYDFDFSLGRVYSGGTRFPHQTRLTLILLFLCKFYVNTCMCMCVNK